MSGTLIPADNFEVHNLRTKKVNIWVGDSAYIPMKGFGIWDKTAKAYVCMNDYATVPGFGKVPVPYALKRKYVAVKACSQGLWNGYTTIKPGKQPTK